MKVQRGKEQADGLLAGHFKDGRLYRTPFTSIDVFSLTDWHRDDLPDLLWLAILAAEFGDEAFDRYLTMAGAAAEALQGAGAAKATPMLDGRLLSLEAVPDGKRETVRRLVGPIIREATSAQATALRLCDGAPGSWLLVESWPEDERLPLNEAVGALSAAVAATLDEHVDALVKAIHLAARVCLGTMTMGPEMTKRLRDYPDGGPGADSMVRAAFGSIAGLPVTAPEIESARIGWAKRFWNTAGRKTPCFTAEELVERIRSSKNEDDSPLDSVNDDAAGSDEEADEAAIVVDARSRIQACVEQFLETIDGEPSVIDFYAPARYEVASGLVLRAARAVWAVVSDPSLWSSEHSSHIVRQLVETEIVLAWLEQAEADAYVQYQQWGRGRLKLHRRVMAEFAESLPGDAPDFLTASIARMEDRLGGDVGEQMIDVSVASTFSGISMRQMADEVGRADLYRLQYQMASGYGHAEWWTIEDEHMTRCVNPLHRFHLMPAVDRPFSSEQRLPGALVSQLTALAQAVGDMLQADPASPD